MTRISDKIEEAWASWDAGVLNVLNEIMASVKFPKDRREECKKRMLAFDERYAIHTMMDTERLEPEDLYTYQMGKMALNEIYGKACSPIEALAIVKERYREAQGESFRLDNGTRSLLPLGRPISPVQPWSPAVITSGASVARYEDARRVLWECGYGAVRVSDLHLEVYEVNPDSTFLSMKEKGLQRFKSLHVPPEHRKGGLEASKEKDSFLVEKITTLTVDEGYFSDVMGEQKGGTTASEWDEVIDATDLFRLVCRRIDPNFSPSEPNCEGRGRRKSDINRQYFELMEKNVELLSTFGLHLYRRKGNSWHGEVEVLERIWPQGGHAIAS